MEERWNFINLPADHREGALRRSVGLRQLRELLTARAFAVELAPALLIGGKTPSPQKNRGNAALYRLRLSAATRRPEDTASPTEIAIGLRVDLIDEADLRMNPEYLDQATHIAQKVNDVYVAARRRVAGARGRPPGPGRGFSRCGRTWRSSWERAASSRALGWCGDRL